MTRFLRRIIIFIGITIVIPIVLFYSFFAFVANPQSGLEGAAMAFGFLFLSMIWIVFSSTFLFHFWRLPIPLQVIWFLLMQFLIVIPIYTQGDVMRNEIFTGPELVAYFAIPWIGIVLARLFIRYNKE